jgi:hypothetical protein
MAELNPEIADLLKELRSFLANGSEPWEPRRELILKINNLVEGGETDMFVGMAREMSRIGATYTNLLQAFAQFGTAQGMNPADWFARMYQPPQAVVPPFMSPAAGFDYFKQLADFMTAQTKSGAAATKPKKEG